MMQRLKTIVFHFLLICLSSTAFAQYDTEHYIPPSRWKYFNDQHEIVFSTLSTTVVTIEIRKSDGTLIANETVVKGSPTRFTLMDPATTNQRNLVNTVFTDEGLIITASEEISVNVRNVNGDTSDAILKGNTSLTSKGKLALGETFHLIYYRSFQAFYGMMATEDNTNITRNGVPLVTLQEGESYVIGGNLADADLGDLIESDKPITMTASYDAESPGQCADPTADQLIPDQIAGSDYIIVRGQGNTNLQIEFFTVMAIEPNTEVVVNGAVNTTLAAPGDYVTISSGATPYDVNFVETTKPVLVAQGAGQGCEHGMSIIPPLRCTGSKHIETKDFNNLDYSVFVLSKCNVSSPFLNDVELTGGMEIPESNWTLFQFDNNNVVGEDIILDSETPMHVGILQDGGQFGGFAYFSGFSRTGIDIQATTSSGDSTIIEGCIPAEFIFTRESFCAEADTILINVSGTATEGVDFNTVPDTLFFTEGVDTLYLGIESFVDSDLEGQEEIQIFILADKNCDNILDTVSKTLYLNDYTPMLLTLDQSELDFCVDYYCSSISESESVQANVVGGLPPYTFVWSDGLTEVGTPTVPSTSINEYSEANGNVPFVDTLYSIAVFDACGNNATVPLSIENNCPVCAPNVITANNDGVNDWFEIDNIQQYPEAVVRIMNRWGNVIYETTDYQNDWSGEGVTEGVYYYSVIIDSEVAIHGFFHVVR